MTKHRKHLQNFVLVFLSFFFLYLFISRGVLTNGDDIIYLSISYLLQEPGTFAGKPAIEESFWAA